MIVMGDALLLILEERNAQWIMPVFSIISLDCGNDGKEIIHSNKNVKGNVERLVIQRHHKRYDSVEQTTDQPIHGGFSMLVNRRTSFPV